MADFETKIRDVQNTVKGTPGLGKRMAKYSAVGAVLAIPIPVIGPVFGAIAGAAFAYSKRNKG